MKIQLRKISKIHGLESVLKVTMSCKRINLTDWEPCGNNIIVDKFHKLCAVHSDERIEKHKKYHKTYSGMINEMNSVKRRQHAELCELEIHERGWYDFRYQLMYLRHRNWWNEVHKMMFELRSSIRHWFKWSITWETLTDIKNSRQLQSLNLNIEKNVVIEEDISEDISEDIEENIEEDMDKDIERYIDEEIEEDTMIIEEEYQYESDKVTAAEENWDIDYAPVIVDFAEENCVEDDFEPTIRFDEINNRKIRPHSPLDIYKRIGKRNVIVNSEDSYKQASIRISKHNLNKINNFRWSLPYTGIDSTIMQFLDLHQSYDKLCFFFFFANSLLHNSMT